MATPKLVMYILVREDLHWPRGPMAAQISHLTAKVVHSASKTQDQPTLDYLNEVQGQMATVILQGNLALLEKKMAKFRQLGIPFETWTEQPENVFTGLALYPRLDSEMRSRLRGLHLYGGPPTACNLQDSM